MNAVDEQIIVRLIAQTDQLRAGMAEGAATVQASTDTMAASCQNAMGAFRDFDNIQKDSVQTAEQVVAAQKAINAAQASGAFTAEESAAKQLLVSAAAEKVGADIKKAAAGVNI